MKSIALYRLGDNNSAAQCRASAKKLGHLWGIRLPRNEESWLHTHHGDGGARWLNAGRDPNTGYPTWSRQHAALYTAEQAAAIVLVLSDGWPDVRVMKLF